MNESDPNIQKLQNLLSCKRHEQPPPGYFERFPDELRRRLEAEELGEYSSLWHWFVTQFDAQPIVACAYGVALSGLLLAGFNLSDVFESEVPLAPVSAWPWMGWAPPAGRVADQSAGFAGRFQETAAATFPAALIPVNGIGSSRFASPNSLQARPALFMPLEN